MDVRKALWRDKACLTLTFTSLYFLQDEIVVTFPEIIAIQIKYNPYSYSCPRSLAIDCKRKESKIEESFYSSTDIASGLICDVWPLFHQAPWPRCKQWLLIGRRNRHELLGCSLFWDHNSEGTFYLMKSGNGTPFRSTLCVCF